MECMCWIMTFDSSACSDLIMTTRSVLWLRISGEESGLVLCLRVWRGYAIIILIFTIILKISQGGAALRLVILSRPRMAVSGSEQTQEDWCVWIPTRRQIRLHVSISRGEI